MNDAIKIAATGAFVFGALYLVGCFTVGLFLNVGWAWKLALASAGVAYLAQLAEASRHAGQSSLTVVYTLMAASIVAAALSGISLLIGG